MEVLVVDGEPVLAADEREAWAEFGEGVLQPIGQSLFQCPLGGSFGEVEEVEDVWVSDDLPGLIGVKRVQLVVEIAGRGTDPLMQSGRDVMFQYRTRPSATGITVGIPIPQRWVSDLVKQCADVPPRQFPNGSLGNCGQAAAKARMYCRLVGDSPFMSGNSLRRSRDSRLMTPDPHGSVSCRDRISRPIRQYMARSSEFAARATCSRVTRTSDLICANRSP